MELDGVNFKITADHSQLPTAEQAMRDLGETAEMTGADMAQMGKQAQSAGQQAAAAGKNMQGAAAGANQASGSFKAMRGATSQLSYQLQDIAVQAQMGTNAFTILAQQGPQIASVFGPGGAVIGAIIGVGAALGGTLVSAMMDVEDESEELELTIKELAEQYDELTAAQRNWLSIRSANQIDEMRSQLTVLENTIESLRSNMRIPIQDQAKLDEWSEEYARVSAEADTLRQRIDELTGGMKGMAGQSAAMVERLELEAETIGLTAEERALHVIAINAENDALVERAAIAVQQIKAYREEQAAIRAAAEERRKAERAAERAAARSKREYDSELKRARNRLDRIAEMNLTEVELAKKRNADMLADLEQWHQRGMISTEEFAAARREIEIAANRDVRESYRDILADLDESTAAYAEYEEMLKRIDESSASVAEKTELMALAQGRLQERLDDIKGDDFWGEWLESASENLMNFDELSKSVIDNFSTGFGNAFESMIFDATSFRDAMQQFAEGMARSVINALGQMAAQWLAYQAVQMIVGKTGQASATAMLVANAQAASLQAGINAFSSTAAIPIIGPALAPGAMAAALGATQPLAAAVAAAAASGMVGMAHDGIDYVPQEGTWLLNKGERVMTSETSAKLDATLDDISNGLSSGASRVSQNIYVTGTVDRRTSAQMAQDAARKQRIATARYGKG